MLTCVSRTGVRQGKPPNTACKVIVSTSVMRKGVEAWMKRAGVIAALSQQRACRCAAEDQKDVNDTVLRATRPYGRLPSTVR
jgi:hypothetical protein